MFQQQNVQQPQATGNVISPQKQNNENLKEMTKNEENPPPAQDEDASAEADSTGEQA